MSIQLHNAMTILFQGDSITDCDRGWYEYGEMGYGYANGVAARLYRRCPNLNLVFINRGVSGDRIEDLVRRWDEDCIQLRPDVVSLLAGVNNTWPRYVQNDCKSDEVFYRDYRSILEKTRDALDAQLVLCEPFLLHVSPEIARWRDDLDPKIEAVRKLAVEFDAILVPFDRMFTEASVRRSPGYWAEDGVHPTMAGHERMADEWVRRVVGDVC